jgi:hypothetical protein
MRAKRLEERKLSDTNDYDYYDMHPYDTRDVSYGHARSSLFFSFSVVSVFASEAMPRLCHEPFSPTRLYLWLEAIA